MTFMKIHSNPSRRRGFALVVTLSLMILLTIVAVGLLTLSSISLRSISQGNSQAVANANARLALMLAIGDLQKALGPDKRISATASSIETTAAQQNLLGCWESHGWQAPAGAVPPPSAKEAKFRSWLTSTKDPNTATSLAHAFSSVSPDAVWLANPATTGTIDSVDTTLRAERVPTTAGTQRGGFAWAVSDNSLKVPINIVSSNSEQLARNVANRTAATSPRPDVLDSAFEKINYRNSSSSNLPNPGDLISMPTAVLAVGSAQKTVITARSQSLTHSSLGLLTDVVKGGLKTDLTPLMEGTANLSTALGAANVYFSANDGGPSWNFLRSHYQFYRRVTNQASGAPRLRLTTTDTSPQSTGIQPRPTRAVMLPVIAKLQILFSMVSHYSHIGDRVSAFEQRASPRGNQQHAVPHLVYDPVITLYNPYDVELDLTHIRIRISDPPVGFQFQKHDMQLGLDSWLRQEFGGSNEMEKFHGLARFQIANEKNASARKFFTLFLQNRNGNSPGGNIVLLPGEVKVFSAFVEPNWSWGLETAGGYTPRAFFDWDSARDVGNTDRRFTSAQFGDLGLRGMPGLDFRAGLQTDHLSYGSGRPADSRYPWESAAPFGAGWVSLKVGDKPGTVPMLNRSDEITVSARPQRVVNAANLPDFRVDILAGSNVDAASDTLRTYEFTLGDVAAEMTDAPGGSKVITRRFKNRDILQEPGDTTPGGKSPFAIFTMTAKTTVDRRDDSKAWLFNNIATDGGAHNSKIIGNAAQSYDLRFHEIQDFTTFPGVEYDAANHRGFFGAIANASRGVSVVPMYRVPLTPAASLGDWIASNLVTSSHFPRVGFPLGNSFAHPLIPANDISAPGMMPNSGRMLDHTYLMNAALWDSLYFSSAAPYTTASFSPTRSKDRVVQDFFENTQPMLNSRLVPYLGASDVKALVTKHRAGADAITSARTFAANAMINGAFNINSDSVDAWRAVLSSLRDAPVRAYKRNIPHQINGKTAFVRSGLPIAGSADDANPENSVDVLGQVRWAGFRTLSDQQIRVLATSIVKEIRARGALDKAPSLCLGDFVNRRPGGASELHALKGILQTAIDLSGINEEFHKGDHNEIASGTLSANRTVGFRNPSALDGKTSDGAPAILTQGDLLAGLAPVITARGDTFTIRAYGEARNAGGSTVQARAWCEATVQRVPEYVDPRDAPEALADSLSATSKLFGRRFVITAFRWLNASEI
jgi:Tfp pilus assembly protein PilX